MSKLPERLDVKAIVNLSPDRLAQPSTAGVLMLGEERGSDSMLAGALQPPLSGVAAATPAARVVIPAASAARRSLRVVSMRSSFGAGTERVLPPTTEDVPGCRQTGMMEARSKANDLPMV